MGESMKRMVGAAAFMLLFVTGCSSSDSDACDPIAQTGCDEGLVCEEVVDGGPACFAPVVLRGNVFDRADDSAIEGATVVALDANSSSASTVGVTDASGNYEMQVARQRDADGNPLGGDVTLRADAAGFQTFPGGIRQALPIDVSNPVQEGGVLVVQTTATDVGLIALPSGAGTNQIFGNVEVPNDSTGVLVVAETAGDSPLGFTAIADRDGVYRIFNLPDGDFSVLGYARGVNYGAQPASVSGGQEVQVDLTISADAPGTVTGSVQIVNPGAGEGTSYILVVESTFNEALARGETPPGLRAPEGTDLVDSGTWMIDGVPVGSYKVLGAFENDRLVRDPDFGQGNTEIVRVDVAAGQSVEAPSFKITGSLDVISPGAEGAEEVDGNPVFSWVDDSGEDRYHIQVFDTFGEIIWSEPNIPGSSGSDPEVPYAGPPLESGMFYQFRVTSFDVNDRPLSRTEDLKGVFFLP
ncbi:MAG: carboxypeptidase regulatory-like domain-containing protein [Deltaproteobacteria bacterium]|nr:carboxypeptidase regulatory-like domain-containing protein [Deltaproteobacteria bacterium]